MPPDSIPHWQDSLRERPPSEGAKFEIEKLKKEIDGSYRRFFPEFSDADVRFLQEKNVSAEFLGTLSELRERHL